MFATKNFNTNRKILHMLLRLFLVLSLVLLSFFYYRNLWDSPVNSLHTNMLIFMLHCGLNFMIGLNLFRCFIFPKDSFDLEVQKWFLVLYCVPASAIIYYLTYDFYPFIHSSVLYFYIGLHVYICFKNNG